MASRRANAFPRPKRATEEFTTLPTSQKPHFDIRNPSALAPDALEDDVFLEADEIGKRGLGTKRNAVQVDGYGSDSSNEGFDGRAEKMKKRQKKKGSEEEEDDDMFAGLEGEKDGDEDEDDDEDEGQGGKMRTKKKGAGKNVRFLAEEEIEGQVAGSRSGGHVSADFSVAAGDVREGPRGGSNGMIADRVRGSGNLEEDSGDESDVAEEERANIGDLVDEEVGAGGKKEHAPKLDAFNMKNEQEEGRFDDQGNFVRKAADADAIHDSWLEGVSKKDMKRAKEAAERRDDELKLKQREDDAVLTSDILSTLIQHLEKTETVLEALARLGKAAKSSRSKWNNSNNNNKNKNNSKRKKKHDQDNDTMAIDPPLTSPRKPPSSSEEDPHTKSTLAIEAITTAATTLYTRSHSDIYDTTREALVRLYTRETGEEWVDPSPPSPPRPKGGWEEDDDEEGDDGDVDRRKWRTRKWEYRWLNNPNNSNPDNNDDDPTTNPINGPFPNELMAQWREAGYFGEGVEFRLVEQGREDGGEGEWLSGGSVEFV